MIIESFAGDPTGKKGLRTLLVYFHDGQLKVIDDHPVNTSFFDAIRKSDIHISIPVDRIWSALFSEMAKRVHGEDWERKNFLKLPAKELRGFSDIALEYYSLSREDIEEHIQDRRGKRRKSRVNEADGSQDGGT